MLSPFLAPSIVAAAFAKLGSMSMQIAYLTMALQVVFVIAGALAMAMAAIYELLCTSTLHWQSGKSMSAMEQADCEFVLPVPL